MSVQEVRWTLILRNQERGLLCGQQRGVQGGGWRQMIWMEPGKASVKNKDTLLVVGPGDFQKEFWQGYLLHRQAREGVQ